MKIAFREAIAATLPSEQRLRSWLTELPERDWAALAGLFAAGLPELDGVIAPPDLAGLAKALARARGIGVLDLTAAPAPLPAGWIAGEVALVTDHLTDGLPELTALLRAERRGLQVRAVVAAVERTGSRGRTRLELQGLRVQAAVQLADTPRGLAFERRTPREWPHVS